MMRDKQTATEALGAALLASLGENDAYPTPEEIAAHKRRGLTLRERALASTKHVQLKGATTMRINSTDAGSVSGFYAVDFGTFAETLGQSEITVSYEMGGGVAIHYGTREGAPVWLLDNALGKLYGIWIEENESAH